MKLRHLASAAAFATLAVCSTASWSVNYQMIDLVSPNHALSAMTSGYKYPAPGDYMFGDVPYRIGTPDVDGFNIWHSADYPPQQRTQTYELPINVFGATEVYTVMNIWWGVAQSQVATVEFFGSAGATYTKALVVGEDLRDHVVGGFVDTVNGTSTIQVFQDAIDDGEAHVRLDRQTFVLPAEFTNQTLERMVITNLTSVVAETDGQGQTFLVAATVAAVPEPQSYALMLAGAGLLAWRMRKRAA